MRNARGIFAVAILLVGVLVTLSAAAEAQEGGTAIGVDVGVDGNSATAIGSVEPCLSVSKDDTFSVDLFVVDVEDLLAWEVYVAYDSKILQVVDRDVQMFQAADTGSSVFNASEAVPGNDDGLFRVAAADTRDPAVGDSGSGVLARLSLKALSEGRTSLSTTPADITGDGTPDVGMTLTDLDGEHIGDSDGDGFFDGSIAVPEVLVDVPADSDCVSAGSTTEPDQDQQPANEDNEKDDGGGGWSWWMIAPIAGAVAALALAALYGARRIGRRPPAGTGGL